MLHSLYQCMKPGEPKKNQHQNLLAATPQDFGQKGHETFSSVMVRRHSMSASFVSCQSKPYLCFLRKKKQFLHMQIYTEIPTTNRVEGSHL